MYIKTRVIRMNSTEYNFTSNFDSGARIVDVDMTSCVTVLCSWRVPLVVVVCATVFSST